MGNVNVEARAIAAGTGTGAIVLPGLLNDTTNPDARIRLYDAFGSVTDFEGRHHDPAGWDQMYSEDAGDIFSRGTWHFVESLVQFNARGNFDGTVKTWVDGVLVLQANDIRSGYDGTRRFTAIELTNIWYGGGRFPPTIITATTTST